MICNIIGTTLFNQFLIERINTVKVSSAADNYESVSLKLCANYCAIRQIA